MTYRRSGCVTLVTALVLVGAMPATGAPILPGSVDAEDTEAAIARLSVSLLTGSQLSHRRLDDQLASRLLDRYLETLDTHRTLFLQSDVDEFSSHEDAFAEAIRVDGDIRYARVIFDRYLTRLGQQVTYDVSILGTRR